MSPTYRGRAPKKPGEWECLSIIEVIMGKSKPHKDHKPNPDPAKSWREAIESIVIAIVLAFLFRAV